MFYWPNCQFIYLVRKFGNLKIHTLQESIKKLLKIQNFLKKLKLPKYTIFHTNS